MTNAADARGDQSKQQPTTQSPQEFYEQFTKRPDIRRILQRLAKT